MKNEQSSFFYSARKLTAFFLSIFFTLLNSPSYVFSYSVPMPAQAYQQLDLSKINIPDHYGYIEDFWKGASDKTIILIQDAHAIPDAQKNIQKIINYFQTKHGVDLVGLEGAYGKLNAELYKSFPNQKILRDVFEDYQEKAEVSGGVMAAIFNKTPSVYHGVENWDLYQEGITLYLSSLQNQSALEAEIKGRREELNVFKRKNYSPQLLEVDRSLELFHSNKLDFATALEQLSQIKNPERKSLRAILAQVHKEKKEANNFEQEVNLTAQKIKEIIGKTNISFNERFQAFQTSQVSSERFAFFLDEFLNNECKYSSTESKNALCKIRLSRELKSEIRELRSFEAIQGTQLFQDFEAYSERIIHSLIQNQIQLKINQEARQLDILERFSKMELSRKDWEEIVKPKSIPFYGEFEKWLQPHFDFYKNTEKRDEVFFEKTKGLLKKYQKNSAIVILGGFHSQGLIHRLKERNISYALIAPRIHQLPERNDYKDHMQGNVSWRSYLKSDNGQIHLFDAFARGTRDKLMSAANKDTTQSSQRILKDWRDQLIVQLANKGEIEQAGRYTKFLDEKGKPEVLNTEIKNQWIANVDEFIKKFKDLRFSNNLSQEDLINSLEPSLIPSWPDSPAVLDVSSNVSEKRVNVSLRSRSEIRSASVDTKVDLPQMRFLSEDDFIVEALKLKGTPFSLKMTEGGVSVYLQASPSRKSPPLSQVISIKQLDGNLYVLFLDGERRKVFRFNHSGVGEEMNLVDLPFRVLAELGVLTSSEKSKYLYQLALQIIDELPEIDPDRVQDAMNEILNYLKTETPPLSERLYWFLLREFLKGMIQPDPNYEEMRDVVVLLRMVSANASSDTLLITAEDKTLVLGATRVFDLYKQENYQNLVKLILALELQNQSKIEKLLIAFDQATYRNKQEEELFKNVASFVRVVLKRDGWEIWDKAQDLVDDLKRNTEAIVLVRALKEGWLNSILSQNPVQKILDAGKENIKNVQKVDIGNAFKNLVGQLADNTRLSEEALNAIIMTAQQEQFNRRAGSQSLSGRANVLLLIAAFLKASNDKNISRMLEISRWIERYVLDKAGFTAPVKARTEICQPLQVILRKQQTEQSTSSLDREVPSRVPEILDMSELEVLRSGFLRVDSSGVVRFSDSTQGEAIVILNSSGVILPTENIFLNEQHREVALDVIKTHNKERSDAYLRWLQKNIGPVKDLIKSDKVTPSLTGLLVNLFLTSERLRTEFKTPEQIYLLFQTIKGFIKNDQTELISIFSETDFKNLRNRFLEKIIDQVTPLFMKRYYAELKEEFLDILASQGLSQQDLIDYYQVEDFETGLTAATTKIHRVVMERRVRFPFLRKRSQDVQELEERVLNSLQRDIKREGLGENIVYIRIKKAATQRSLASLKIRIENNEKSRDGSGGQDIRIYEEGNNVPIYRSKELGLKESPIFVSFVKGNLQISNSPVNALFRIYWDNGDYKIEKLDIATVLSIRQGTMHRPILVDQPTTLRTNLTQFSSVFSVTPQLFNRIYGENLYRVEVLSGLDGNEILENTTVRARYIEGRESGTKEAAVKMLQDLGMTPAYKLTIASFLNGAQTIYLSRKYVSYGDRTLVVAYLWSQKDQKYVARIFWLSNSQGVWRYLPFYVDSWNSKGVGENSTNLPFAISAALANRWLSNDVEQARMTREQGQELIRLIVPNGIQFSPEDEAGLTGIRPAHTNSEPDYLDNGRDFNGNRDPNSLLSELDPKINPEDLKFLDAEDETDFTQFIWEGVQAFGPYQGATLRAFFSKNKQYLHVYYDYTGSYSDGKRSVWLHIEPVKKITEGSDEFILNRNWISSYFVLPPREYEDQTPMRFMGESRGGSYVDVYETFLSRLKPIRDYLEQYGEDEADSHKTAVELPAVNPSQSLKEDAHRSEIRSQSLDSVGPYVKRLQTIQPRITGYFIPVSPAAALTHGWDLTLREKIARSEVRVYKKSFREFREPVHRYLKNKLGLSDSVSEREEQVFKNEILPALLSRLKEDLQADSTTYEKSKSLARIVSDLLSGYIVLRQNDKVTESYTLTANDGYFQVQYKKVNDGRIMIERKLNPNEEMYLGLESPSQDYFIGDAAGELTLQIGIVLGLNFQKKGIYKEYIQLLREIFKILQPELGLKASFIEVVVNLPTLMAIYFALPENWKRSNPKVSQMVQLWQEQVIERKSDGMFASEGKILDRPEYGTVFELSEYEDDIRPVKHFQYRIHKILINFFNSQDWKKMSLPDQNKIKLAVRQTRLISTFLNGMETNDFEIQVSTTEGVSRLIIKVTFPQLQRSEVREFETQNAITGENFFNEEYRNGIKTVLVDFSKNIFRLSYAMVRTFPLFTQLKENFPNATIYIKSEFLEAFALGENVKHVKAFDDLVINPKETVFITDVVNSVPGFGSSFQRVDVTLRIDAIYLKLTAFGDEGDQDNFISLGGSNAAGSNLNILQELNRLYSFLGFRLSEQPPYFKPSGETLLVRSRLVEQVEHHGVNIQASPVLFINASYGSGGTDRFALSYWDAVLKFIVERFKGVIIINEANNDTHAGVARKLYSMINRHIGKAKDEKKPHPTPIIIGPNNVKRLAALLTMSNVGVLTVQSGVTHLADALGVENFVNLNPGQYTEYLYNGGNRIDVTMEEAKSFFSMITNPAPLSKELESAINKLLQNLSFNRSEIRVTENIKTDDALKKVGERDGGEGHKHLIPENTGKRGQHFPNRSYYFYLSGFTTGYGWFSGGHDEKGARKAISRTFGSSLDLSSLGRSTLIFLAPPAAQAKFRFPSISNDEFFEGILKLKDVDAEILRGELLKQLDVLMAEIGGSSSDLTDLDGINQLVRHWVDLLGELSGQKFTLVIHVDASDGRHDIATLGDSIVQAKEWIDRVIIESPDGKTSHDLTESLRKNKVLFTAIKNLTQRKSFWLLIKMCCREWEKVLYRLKVKIRKLQTWAFKTRKTFQMCF